MEPKNKEMKLMTPSKNSTMARTKGFRPPTVPSRPMYVMLSAAPFVPLELLFCFFIWNEKQKSVFFFYFLFAVLLRVWSNTSTCSRLQYVLVLYFKKKKYSSLFLHVDYDTVL